MLADVALRLVGLGDGVVAVPFLLTVLIAVVERVVVGMGAAEGLPEFKPLAPLARNEGTATLAVEVPFADVRGSIARAAIHLGNRHGVIVQRHVVQEDAVR